MPAIACQPNQEAYAGSGDRPGDFLDRAVRFARSVPAMHRFTWMTRMLLAMAFLPTGLVKVINHRFTTISVESPIGRFFETMYQTTDLWIFIGVVQMVAAIFLLIPRMRTLGAVMFFPIILSIVLITHSLHFGNTVIITCLMLLAVTYLLVWDYARIKNALRAICGARTASEFSPSPDRPIRISWFERAGWCGVTASSVLLLASVRDLVPFASRRALLVFAAVSILILSTSWILAVWSAWRRE